MPEPYGPVHSNWKIKAGADLGGDGLPDFVFQNETSSALVVWDMEDLIRIDGLYQRLHAAQFASYAAS